MGNDDKKIGVTQKAVIWQKDGTILAIRRSKTHPFRPLHWDLPGGDLGFGEDPKKGMLREIAEETSIKVVDLKVIDAVSVFNESGEFWVTIGYSARSESDKVALSYEHDTFMWIKPNDFKKLKVSDRSKKIVERFASIKK